METVYWVMPLLAMITVGAALYQAPSGRRTPVLIYIGIGVGVGIFGILAVQPIQAGGLNLQFLVLPFLFATWFFIGFTTAWAVGILSTAGGRSSRRILAGVLFTVAAIPLALNLLDLTYVPHVFHRDYAYWETVFAGSASPEQLKVAPERLSSRGRSCVSEHLDRSPDDITTPVLTTLHALGFDVLHARNTSPEIVAAAITSVQAKLAHESSEWQRSNALAPLAYLASNPTLDEKTFQLLATIGDDRVICRLIHNRSNDDARLQILRDTIQARVSGAWTGNGYDRWPADRLREQLDQLDQWRRSKLPKK